MEIVLAYLFVGMMHNLMFYIVDSMILQLNKEKLQQTSSLRLFASLFWILTDIFFILTFIFNLIYNSIHTGNKK